MNAPSAFHLGCILAAALAGSPRRSDAQNGVPRPDHVVVVIEENKTFRQIFNSPDAPYINGLTTQGALFLSSFGIRHPSEPNYLALFSGSTHGLGDDSCPHSYEGPNLGTALFEAGLTFAGYSESMPHLGYLGCETGAYARKHNPWANFRSVPDTANVPFTAFPANYAELPTVAFVVPNLDNDMHDGSIRRGDDWLRDHFGAYIQWANTHNSLFVLTWDEDNHSGNNQIFTLMLGPMVRPGRYCERIDHYALLRTLVEMFQLTPFGLTASADAITSVWKPDAVDSPIQIAITSPTDGSSMNEPAIFDLQVEATSVNGAISRVEFFEGPKSLGVITEPPFALRLNNVVAGPHCYVAKAMDNAGAKRTSTSIQVTVMSSNVFMSAAGAYSGLFFETNGVVNEHAGAADFTVSSRGTFTARLTRARQKARATGTFDQDGVSSITIGRGDSNQLTAELELGLPPAVGFIRGRVVGANWEAPLVAYRTSFDAEHPSTLSGRYTMRLRFAQSASDTDPVPRGDGVVAASIARDAKVTLLGTLADGTKVTARTSASPDGNVPFYRPLYHNGGSIIGWLKFSSQSPNAEGGELIWTKPASSDPRYPLGFQISTTVGTAVYSFTALTNSLATAPNWQVQFALDTGESWTRDAMFSLRAHRLSKDRDLVLTLARTTGLWSGRYVDPGTHKSWLLGGTILQPEQTGSGFMVTPTQSGMMTFGAVGTNQ